jgi:hypothetical protein
MKKEIALVVTACKQYCLAAGAAQGYERLHAKRWNQLMYNALKTNVIYKKQLKKPMRLAEN